MICLYLEGQIQAIRTEEEKVHLTEYLYLQQQRSAGQRQARSEPSAVAAAI